MTSPFFSSVCRVIGHQLSMVPFLLFRSVRSSLSVTAFSVCAKITVPIKEGLDWPPFSTLGFKQAIWGIAHRLCRLIWEILHQGVQYAPVNQKAKRARTVKMIRELRNRSYHVELLTSIDSEGFVVTSSRPGASRLSAHSPDSRCSSAHLQFLALRRNSHKAAKH